MNVEETLRAVSSEFAILKAKVDEAEEGRFRLEWEVARLRQVVARVRALGRHTQVHGRAILKAIEEAEQGDLDEAFLKG
jgi:hypothetical protein